MAPCRETASAFQISGGASSPTARTRHSARSSLGRKTIFAAESSPDAAWIRSQARSRVWPSPCVQYSSHSGQVLAALIYAGEAPGIVPRAVFPVVSRPRQRCDACQIRGDTAPTEPVPWRLFIAVGKRMNRLESIVQDRGAENRR